MPCTLTGAKNEVSKEPGASRAPHVRKAPLPHPRRAAHWARSVVNTRTPGGKSKTAPRSWGLPGSVDNAPGSALTSLTTMHSWQPRLAAAAWSFCAASTKDSSARCTRIGTGSWLSSAASRASIAGWRCTGMQGRPASCSRTRGEVLSKASRPWLSTRETEESGSWSLRRVSSTASWDTSIPSARRPKRCAASKAVPLPQHGSNTRPPGSLAKRKIRSSNANGFCVG